MFPRNLGGVGVGVNKVNYSLCENSEYKERRIGYNISSMRRSVSSLDETLRRELKILRAAGYFLRTSRCFIW